MYITYMEMEKYSPSFYMAWEYDSKKHEAAQLILQGTRQCKGMPGLNILKSLWLNYMKKAQTQEKIELSLQRSCHF